MNRIAWSLLLISSLLLGADRGVDRKTAKRLAADPQRFVPHYAAGAEWTTTVRVVNYKSKSVMFRLSVFDTKGNPRTLQINGTTASDLSATIPPRGISEMVLSSNDGLKTGLMGVDFLGDDRLPFTVLFKTASKTEGAISYDEYPDQWLAFVQFDNTDGAATGIAVADISPLSTSGNSRIELTCFNQVGSQIGSFVGLASGQQQAAFDLGEKLPASRGAKGICTFTYKSDYSTWPDESLSVLSLQFKGVNFLPLK